MKHGYFKGNKVAEVQDSQTALMDRFKKQGIVDEWRDADSKKAPEVDPSRIDIPDNEPLSFKTEAEKAAERAEAERLAAEEAARVEAERLAAQKAGGGNGGIGDNGYGVGGDPSGGGSGGNGNSWFKGSKKNK
jgi:hypothetical protein